MSAMTAMEPLCHLIGINHSKLSKKEYLLLEAEIFICLCEALKEFFREQHKDYFRFMKFTEEMEDIMLETNLACLMTNDILSTAEYDLNGIACYTDTPKDVVQEIIDGRNVRPSAIFLWRIIELHRSIRRDLYDAVVKKLLTNI